MMHKNIKVNARDFCCRRMGTIKKRKITLDTSWLKYLRRACITHGLGEGGKKYFKIMKSQLKKGRETDTGNDKPCCEATVRMIVVSIFV